ncbi:MAG: cytochrome P450, partial [Myxococcota bacterium]
DEVEPFGVHAAVALLGPQSLLLVRGEAHRREREILTPPFHGRRMNAYGQVMREAALRATADWRVGDDVVLADTFLRISLDIIVHAVFGVLDADDAVRWTETLRQLVRRTLPAALFVPALQTPFFGLSPWDRFAVARDRLDVLIAEAIRMRRASGERGPDLLSLMLDATYDDGTPMPDSAIRDELVTMLFAGHETTQIALAWAVYRLHRRPDALERLLDELSANDDDPEVLAKLPWLDAVVKESLRMQPIVPDIVRTLTVDLTLGGHDLPSGTHVAPVAALVHADPELYPEPEAFRPERFEERTFRPWEYLPFGGGVRRCIGAALATWEMKVVLGTLLPRFGFALRGTETAVRRNITMGPRHGVRVRITRAEPVPQVRSAAS